MEEDDDDADRSKMHSQRESEQVELRNVCYRWVRNVLSYLLLSKNVNIITYRSLLVTSVVLGCDIWCATVGEEHTVGVFENGVLRGIFGPKRKDVSEKWRRLHNEKLHCLYSSLDIIFATKRRGIIWVGHVARIGERRDAYRILAEKP